MTLAFSFLPGLEDVLIPPLPPAPRDWDEALDRLERQPARRSVLAALRSLMGTRMDTLASNQTILGRIVTLGLRPMAEDALQKHLKSLERDGFIVRIVAKGTVSRRRIRVVFRPA